VVFGKPISPLTVTVVCAAFADIAALSSKKNFLRRLSLASTVRLFGAAGPRRVFSQRLATASDGHALPDRTGGVRRACRYDRRPSSEANPTGEFCSVAISREFQPPKARLPNCYSSVGGAGPRLLLRFAVVVAGQLPRSAQQRLRPARGYPQRENGRRRGFGEGPVPIRPSKYSPLASRRARTAGGDHRPF